MNRKNNKRYLPVLLGIFFTTGVSILTWGAFSWAYFTDFLTVNQVRLYGCTIIREAEYRSILGELYGNTIGSIDVAEIGYALETHPFVQAARVSKQFPGTIKIELAERRPLAIVNIDPPVMIDCEGVVLPIEDNVIEFEIPILSNFNSARELYPIGNPAISQKVRETTALLNRILKGYPKLYENLSEIRLNHQDEFELILVEEPTRVSLGITNIWHKLLILREFERTLNHQKKLTDYKYLDLRYNNQVIAKEWHT